MRRISRELRRQAVLMAQHAENDALDDWNEAIYDWEGLGEDYPDLIAGLT
jgi:hypothetical protein